MIIAKNSNGLTLTEIVVVIAVIAVLGSLIMLGLVQYRHAADRAEGSSNLRQIGIAALLYIHEHNGELPGLAFISTTESGGIRDYLGMRDAVEMQGRQPPTLFSSPAIQRGPYPSGDRFAVSYSINGHLFCQRWRHESSHFTAVVENAFLVENPAQTMLFTDGRVGIPIPDDPSVYHYPRHVRSAQWVTPTLQFPYRGKQQVLFLDGHVAERGPDEVNLDYRDTFWTGGVFKQE